MSLGISQARAQAFRCPYCNNMIDSTLSRCSFCGNPVDQNWSRAAENYLQDRISDAYNHATYVKMAGQAMIGTFLMGFIPIVGIVGSLAHFILMAAVPILAIVWAARFLGLQTQDQAFREAKRAVLIGLVVWALMIVLPIILWVVISLAG